MSDKPEWDWSTTPPWLNWLAMDANGSWVALSEKPTVNDGILYLSGEFMLIPEQHAPKWSGDWKDSLVCRPGAELKP